MTNSKRTSNTGFIRKIMQLSSLLLLLNIFGVQLFAQAPVFLNPMEHELRVFTNSESKELFWPLNKPVYVRLAVSPEQGAESHLLQKMFIRNDEGAKRADNHDINLDMSGNQFIRWVDANTQDTLMLRFQADGTPPVSDIVMKKAERYSSKNEKFFGSGLSIEIKSHDRHSGVQNRYLSVNRGDYDLIDSDLILEEEGYYELWYYAVDNVGNAERPSYKEFVVDLTPPASEHRIAGLYLEATLSEQATISLSSSDALSGVAEIKYRILPGGNFETYQGGEISLDHLEDGNYTLEYYAVDNVGNVENVNQMEFYLDRIPPVADISVSGDKFESDEFIYVSPRSTFELTAEDNHSGTDRIEYIVDGQRQGRYSQPFRVPAIQGERAIAFTATDKMQNTSEEFSHTFFMDVTPPVTEFSVEGPYFQQNTMHWITSESKIKLSASDKGAGLKEIVYDLENSLPVTVYKEPILLPDETRYFFSFFARDRVNNEEDMHIIMLQVDNTAPEIVANFNTPALEDDALAYAVGTRLFLVAADARSGVARLTYQINDGDVTAYQTPVRFTRPGTYEMKITAVDNLGNIAVEILSIEIREDRDTREAKE